METTTSVAAPEPKPSFFVNRNFGLLWIGQAISDLGDMIYFVTLSLWIATVIAKNQPWAPIAVSGVMIANALPTLTLGPLAGVFVDRWFIVGVQWALMVNALSFVVSFVAILAVRVPADGRESGTKTERTNFLRELKEGMSFYRQSRLMLTLLISVLVVTLGTGAFDALLVFFYQKNLHAPTRLFGTLPMAVGAGSVLGALLVKRLGSARVFWLSLYIISILLIFFARQSDLWPALILLCLVGLPLGALNTALGPLLMHIIPHEIMGRVISVFATSQTLCNLISVSMAGLLGTLLVGFHANLLGMAFGTYDTIYVVTGLLFLLGAFYAMVNLRGLKLT